MSETVSLKPIATVIAERTEPSDDFWGDVRSIIRLNPEFSAETLEGLEEFSHLEVVWFFHKASRDDVHLGARHPRNNPEWPRTGTFVHRNHRRPAQIAVSHPRLIRIEGTDLYVADLDAIDGTPVLDIAPWFTEFGPRGTVTQPAWPTQMLDRYWAVREDH